MRLQRTRCVEMGEGSLCVTLKHLCGICNLKTSEHECVRDIIRRTLSSEEEISRVGSKPACLLDLWKENRGTQALRAGDMRTLVKGGHLQDKKRGLRRSQGLQIPETVNFAGEQHIGRGCRQGWGGSIVAGQSCSLSTSQEAEREMV